MTPDRELLLSFIASLTLADHIGDVGDDAFKVLKKLGIIVPDDDGDWQVDVAKEMSRRGIKTLYGNSLKGE